MATPSVLTVPSMYGDGILYSGPTVFGSELVTNGTFDTDLTGWNTIVNVTWSANFGGSAFFDSSVAESQCRQTLSYQVGKTYEVSWEVKENNGCDFFRIYINNAYTNITNPYVGGHSLRFTHTVGSIFILRNGKIGSDITIDNVSVKEITQGSDFDFTRATTGTRINEDGYIEDVPYNFIPYSQDIDNSDWDKVGITVSANEIIAPDNSLTGDKINENAGGTYHNVNHDDGVTNGTTYTASAYFKAAERTTACIYENLGIGGGSYPLSSFNLSNGTVDSQDSNHIAKISSAGSGWYRCSITFTANATRTGSIYYAPNNQLTYTGVLNSGVFMWGAQFVKGDKIKYYLPTTDRVNLPRLNYPVYGGCPSLLLEPQRQNRLDYSQDFSNWTKVNVTIGASTELSPEGIANANLFSNLNETSAYLSNSTLTLTIGVTYTFSVFVKKVNTRWIRIASVASGTSGCWFDLDNGVLGTVNSESATIEKYPNNWYRITNTFVATATSGSTIVFMGISANDNSTVAELNGQFLIYGAQVEAGSYATSLIHTSGAAVTRNEDKAFNAGLGTTDTFNDSEGVLYAEISVLDTDSANKIITLSNGTNSTRVAIRCVNTLLIAQLRISGSNQYEFAYTLPNMTDNFKIAIKYKVNDFSLYVNGSKLDSSNSGNVFSSGTLTELAFDDGGGSSIFNGNVKAVAVYKTALTDTELANLTSYNNHDLFIPYRSRMQMISADQELQCTEHDITRFL